MINFNFNLYNPFSNRWDIIWTKSKLLTQHKTIEFNGYKTNSILQINFTLSSRCDHAGVNLMVGLFGYIVELHFYDTRHWDNINNCWGRYDV